MVAIHSRGGNPAGLPQFLPCAICGRYPTLSGDHKGAYRACPNGHCRTYGTTDHIIQPLWDQAQTERSQR